MNSQVAIVSAWIGVEPTYVRLAEKNHRSYCAQHNYDYWLFRQDEVSTMMGGVPKEAADIWWIKPYVIQHLLDLNYEYVFWTDMDSLFLNQTVSLSDLQGIGASFVFTGDLWDLCSAGHLWFRNTPFTRDFLESWLTWRGVKVPSLLTAHKTSTHEIGDQPALNIQLHGGLHADVSHAVQLFNCVNGHPSNKDRVHRHFRWVYSPTRAGNLNRSQSLIHSTLSRECKVIVQDRLNAYPFRNLPGRRARGANPIVHFPGGSKDLMSKYAALVAS